MADQLARMRQLVGSPTAWAAHDLTLGDGELAIERVNANTVRARVGDGVKKYSEAPYLAGIFDLTAADLRYVKQSDTVLLGGVAAANKWPRLGSNGKLDPSLVGIPSVLHYKGVTNPAQPPPPGAVSGDTWIAQPAGIVDAGWGPPVAGLAANEGDMLIMGTSGAWALVSGAFDFGGMVLKADLAGPGGAGTVGTQDGDTVEEALAALEAADAAQGGSIAAVDAAVRLRVGYVGTLAELAAYDPASAKVCYLFDPLRGGTFHYNIGAVPAGDPQQGLYVASSAGGYWRREWDGIEGRPEWFGAQPNNGGANCAVGIHACIANCPRTLLAAADYWITETIIISQSNRELRGVYGAVYQQGNGSRLILTGATAANRGTVLFVGKTAPVATVAECTDWPIVSGLSLHRDYGAFPAPPHPSNKIINNDKAFIAAYVQNGRFSQIKTFGSRIGFQAFGCVSTDFTDCAYNGYNSVGGAVAGDYRVGFLFGGPDILLGMAGANASLRATRCGAVVGSGVDPTGLLLWGRYVDTFVDDFESAGVKWGIVLDGTDLTGDNTNIINRGNVIADPNAHADTRIHRSTLDQCAGGGLFIIHANMHALIEIGDCYVTPNTANAWGIGLYDSLGALTITGGQIGGQGTCYGFRADHSQSFTVNGLKIRECYVPCELIGCQYFRVFPHVQNYLNNAAGAAITLDTTCTRGAVGGTTAGGNGRFSMGVWVANNTSVCSIDTTGFSLVAIIASNPAFKARWEGVTDCRTEPAFAAQGNVLVGVTN